MFDRATQIRAVDLCHRLRPVAGTEDLAAEIRAAYLCEDALRLADAMDRADGCAVPARPAEGRIPGLPPAAAVDQVAALSAELGTYVQEGRLPPARQRAHTRALLGALHDAEALAFAVAAVRRTLADCY
jgi:hypothetical protein